MPQLGVLSDAPVSEHRRDLLNFDRYVRPLLSVLTDPHTSTPFTIGIFGTWGCGKTSLMALLDDRLKTEYGPSFVRVHFNPWMHRGETNMLVPLLHAFHDTLEEDPLHRFAESARKIGDVLLRLGSDFLLKHLTANAVSLEKLEKLERNYLTAHGRVESEIRRLHDTLQAEADKVAKDNARIVLFVDDLDRCDPTQIIDLLEAVKLFFDLRHTFIILAVDKEIIDRGIEVKFGKFSFAADRAVALGAEYLEKMIQLPLQLFPLDQQQVHNFIEHLKPAPSILAQLDLLQQVVVPNPRKIKRILNILAVVDSLVESTPPLKDLAPDLIARLVVLQVQYSDLYSAITRYADLLPTLEAIFAGKIKVDSQEDFINLGLGGRAKRIQELCRLYCTQDALAPLFHGSRFQEHKALLPLYLSMLGV